MHYQPRWKICSIGLTIGLSSKKIKGPLRQHTNINPLQVNPIAKVNNITTRGGKATRDPPYPKEKQRTSAPVQPVVMKKAQLKQKICYNHQELEK